MLHPYRVNGEAKGPKWSFNGDYESPTFSPSLLVNPGDKYSQCHLFVTNGQIQYCNDSFHQLSGKTIPMVDIPDLDVWLD